MRHHITRTLQALVLVLCSYLMVNSAVAQGVSADRMPAPECMGVGHDGSQTIRSYGTGHSRQEAIEQAEKNAVYAVLFKGILDGQQGCDVRPILAEANVQEKYEGFFNGFFGMGEYHEYIETLEVKQFSKGKPRRHQSVTYMVVVRVYRNELKQRMREARILPDDSRI